MSGECNKTCKKCNKKGNELIHNCDECIDIKIINLNMNEAIKSIQKYIITELNTTSIYKSEDYIYEI